MGGRSPLIMATEAMISLGASPYRIFCSIISHTMREKENLRSVRLISKLMLFLGVAFSYRKRYTHVIISLLHFYAFEDILAKK